MPNWHYCQCCVFVKTPMDTICTKIVRPYSEKQWKLHRSDTGRGFHHTNILADEVNSSLNMFLLIGNFDRKRSTTLFPFVVCLLSKNKRKETESMLIIYSSVRPHQT